MMILLILNDSSAHVDSGLDTGGIQSERYSESYSTSGMSLLTFILTAEQPYSVTLSTVSITLEYLVHEFKRPSLKEY